MAGYALLFPNADEKTSQSGGIQSMVPGVRSPGSGAPQVCNVSEIILSNKLAIAMPPAFSTSAV